MYLLATANGALVSLQNVDSKFVLAPASIPSTANGCAFSPDGSLLAVAHTASPHITIYNTSDWSKVANPAQLPPSTSNGCAFSPDGSLLAVGHGGYPYITVYNTSTWAKLANPSVLPPSVVYGCAFSPDGSLLAVAHDSSPHITVYNPSTWAVESGFSLVSANSIAVSFGNSPAHRIRGTVRDKDGNLVSRTVRAHRRSDGVLVAQTVSAAMTGEYELLVYPDSPAEEYDVQFLVAPGELLNDLIYARTTAEAVP